MLVINRVASAQGPIAMINGDLIHRSTHGDSLSSQVEIKRGYRDIIVRIIGISLAAVLLVESIAMMMEAVDSRDA